MGCETLIRQAVSYVASSRSPGVLRLKKTLWRYGKWLMKTQRIVNRRTDPSMEWKENQDQRCRI